MTTYKVHLAGLSPCRVTTELTVTLPDGVTPDDIDIKALRNQVDVWHFPTTQAHQRADEEVDSVEIDTVELVE